MRVSVLNSTIFSFALYAIIGLIAVSDGVLYVVAHVSQVTEDVESTWYDCSEEIGISDTKMLTFTHVRSEPPILTPNIRQKILKTVEYAPRSPSNATHTPPPTPLRKIDIVFHQYYKVFDRKWMTFLKLGGIDACHEHDNLCPLPAGDPRELVTVHPALNRLTPYGWYRSRQIYTDVETGVQIGCVDMAFPYCEAADKCKDRGEEVEEEEEVEPSLIRRRR